jgi:hypothetical protein
LARPLAMFFGCKFRTRHHHRRPIPGWNA